MKSGCMREMRPGEKAGEAYAECAFRAGGGLILRRRLQLYPQEGEERKLTPTSVTKLDRRQRSLLAIQPIKGRAAALFNGNWCSETEEVMSVLRLRESVILHT